MKNLLNLIEEELQNISTTTICPVCAQRQLFEITDFRQIRLGKNADDFISTGEFPKIQCKHCQKIGKTTLIMPDKKFLENLEKIVINALCKQEPIYIDANLNDINIVTYSREKK